MKIKRLFSLIILIILLSINSISLAYIDVPRPMDLLHITHEEYDTSYRKYTKHSPTSLRVYRNSKDYFYRDGNDFYMFEEIKNNLLAGSKSFYEAKQGLEPYIELNNYENLNNALKDYKVNEDLKDLYTEETYNKYKESFDKLEEFSNHRFIKQSEVDEVIAKARTDFENLEKLESINIVYEFRSSDDKYTLPSVVSELLPEGKEVAKNSEVTPENPAQLSVKTAEGVWDFKGYEKVESEDSIKFIGTWEFTPNEPDVTENEYTISYKFISKDGKELPKEVLDNLPADEIVKHGTTNAPTAPKATSVTVEDGKWEFISYDKKSIPEIIENGEFIGTWEFKPFASYKVKYLQVLEDGTTSEIKDMETFTSDKVVGETFKLTPEELTNFTPIDTEISKTLGTDTVFEVRYNLKKDVASKVQKTLSDQIEGAISRIKSNNPDVYFTYDEATREIGFNFKDPNASTMNSLASALSGSGIFDQLQGVSDLDALQFGSVNVPKSKINNSQYMFDHVEEIINAFNITEEEISGVTADIDGKYADVKTFGKTEINGEKVSFTDDYKFIFKVVPEEEITITYKSSDSNMGSVSNSEETLKSYTGKVAGSEATANEGYKFINWTDDNGKVISSSANFVPDKKSANYIANFEAEKYIVRFLDKDGNVVSENEVEYGKSVKSVDAPTIEGYDFIKWDYDFTSPIKSKVDIKPIYKAKTYTVSFDGLEETQEVEYGKLATKPTEKPNKEGYTFTGWDYDFNTPITEAKEIKANWDINKLTVSFDGLEETQEVEYGKFANEPTEKPTKEGYTFTGWDYDFNTPITEAKEIKANWEINKYTVSFEGIEETQEVEYGKFASEPYTKPEKEGYTFAGWNFDFKNTPIKENITIQARFNEIPEYKVNFEGIDEVKIVRENTTVSAPNEKPTKEGYTFTGWDFDFDSAITADTNIKANWEINKYTVSFDGLEETQEVEYGKLANEPTEKPTKEGYNFTGWDFDFNTPITEAKEIKANWDINKLTVSFEGLEETQEVEYGKLATEPTEKPTKEGYNFTGWDFDFDTPITESKEIKANWKIIKYTISFNSNGGSKVAPITVEKDEKVNSPAIPKKEGYKFIKWDLNGKTYMFGNPVNSDIKLDAVWEIEKYTVKFMYGQTLIDKQTVEYGEKVNRPETDPKREGYKHIGWSINKGGTPLFDLDTPIKENITLLAVFEQEKPVEKFTVTFDSNGGSEVEPITVEEGGKVTAPTPPTRDGYEFKGWTLDNKEYDFGKEVNSNITLKAYWENAQIRAINNHRSTQVARWEKDEATHVGNKLNGRYNVVRYSYDYSDPRNIDISMVVRDDYFEKSLQSVARKSAIPYHLMYAISDYTGSQSSPSDAAKYLESAKLSFDDGFTSSFVREGNDGLSNIVKNSFTKGFFGKIPNTEILNAMLSKFNLEINTTLGEIKDKSPIKVELTYRLSNGDDYTVVNNIYIKSAPASQFESPDFPTPNE